MTDDLPRIREAREVLGLSQEHLARLAGTNQQTVHRIESGSTTWSKHYENIVKALLKFSIETKTDIDALVQYHGESQAKILRSRVENDHQKKSRQKIRDEGKFKNDSPINHIDLLWSTTSRPGSLYVNPKTIVFLDVIGRIVDSSDVYAVYLASTDMQPELEAGDIIIVDPNLPVIENTTCVFINELGTKHEISVKRLLSQTADDWHVTAWGSKVETDLPKSIWAECHRVSSRLVGG